MDFKWEENIGSNFDFNIFFEGKLQELKDSGNYRHFQSIDVNANKYPYATFSGRYGERLNATIWCSNDYLGMGKSRLVRSAVSQYVSSGSAGSGGTRNISGTTEAHKTLEKTLAHLHQTESALVLNSGYTANVATIGTIGKCVPDCVIFSDECNHASMIEGIRQSRADKVIFKHNSPEDLERALSSIDSVRPKLVAFESVYSMDGDIAPISEMVDVAKSFDVMVFVDEVHAVGLYGPKGAGIAALTKNAHRIDIIQGTLGKAFGLVGGYIAGSTRIVDFVRSFAPGFIFSTSLPSCIVHAANEAIVHLMESDRERELIHRNVRQIKLKLVEANVEFIDAESHIIPIIVRGASRCRNIADRLLYDFGIYLQPINYPTVPVGTERLRIAVSPLHGMKDIDALVNALRTVLGVSKIKKGSVD